MASSRAAARVKTVNGTQGVLLSGFAQLEGKTVSAFFAELDCGDYVVSGGQIFVPFQADPDKLLTLAYLQNLSRSGYEYQVQVKYTNPNPANQTMMQLPPISSTVLAHFTYLNYGSQALPDWTRDRVTFLLPGYGPLCGLLQYQISTGDFIQYVKLDGVFGGTMPQYYDPAITYGW